VGPFPGTSAAQASGYVERKAIGKVAPVYPDLAKRMHIAGAVKLEVVIQPDGNVESTRVVGGSPVLVQSATDAVRKWKFVAAPDETVGLVEITFEPR